MPTNKEIVTVSFDIQRIQQYLNWQPLEQVPDGPYSWQRLRSRRRYPHVGLWYRADSGLFMATIMSGGPSRDDFNICIGLDKLEAMDLEHLVVLGTNGAREICSVKIIDASGDFIRVSNHTPAEFVMTYLDTTQASPLCRIR